MRVGFHLRTLPTPLHWRMQIFLLTRHSVPECRRLLPRTRSAEIRNARILYETLFPAFGPLSRRCNRPIISIKIGRYQKCKDFIGDLGSCVWTGPSADPARRLTDRRQRRSHLLHLQR